MTIAIGKKFQLELGLRSVFVRLPWIGQAFIAPGSGWSAVDRWATLKMTGEV